LAFMGIMSKRARPRDLSDVVTEMQISPCTVESPGIPSKNPVLPIQLVAVTVERESLGKLMPESRGHDPGLLVRGPREVLEGQAICPARDYAERSSDLSRPCPRQKFLHLQYGDARRLRGASACGGSLN
jgi:hypothetical protein